MPINKKDYPYNWKKLVIEVKKRAGDKCELCGIKNYSTNPRGKQVILTIHHIDRNKKNNKLINLIALCQKCHLRLDLEMHMENAKKTRQTKKGERELPFFYKEGT